MAFVQNFPLCLRGNADHPVDHLRPAAGRCAGADLDAGELLRSQMGDDIFNAIVPARATLKPDAKLPRL